MSPSSPFQDVNKELKTTKAVLEAYIIAINLIDDYFEYNHKSDIDKKYVMKAIDSLSEKVRDIYDT